jgi:hypothetical protein
MKKAYLFALALAIAPFSIVAQQPDGARSDEPTEQRGPIPGGRPSTYDQACYVRDHLGLSQDQFFKIYEAYAKYNKAVFGEEPSANAGFGGQPQGNRPAGGPGGGPGGPGGGPGGGMGGPGGGGPGGHGGPGQMGDPRGGMSSASTHHKAPKALSEKDIQKLHKTMEKQEKKLCKTMKKVLGNSDLYDSWLELRAHQMPQAMPPAPPTDAPAGN